MSYTCVLLLTLMYVCVRVRVVGKKPEFESTDCQKRLFVLSNEGSLTVIRHSSFLCRAFLRFMCVSSYFPFLHLHLRKEYFSAEEVPSTGV